MTTRQSPNHASTPRADSSAQHEDAPSGYGQYGGAQDQFAPAAGESSGMPDQQPELTPIAPSAGPHAIPGGEPYRDARVEGTPEPGSATDASTLKGDEMSDQFPAVDAVTPASATASQVGQQTVSDGDLDQALARGLRRRLRDLGIDADTIDVQCQGDVVTVSGVVSDAGMKAAIENSVRVGVGSAHIDNRIQVRATSAQSGLAAAQDEYTVLNGRSAQGS